MNSSARPTNEHTIRLRRPWNKQVNANATRIDVPEPTDDLCDGNAVYQRNFNRPGSLEPDDVVRLDVHAWQGELISLCINDQEFQPSITNHHAKLEITGFLQDHNRIQITLAPATDLLPCLLGPVNLVIISAS